MDKVLIITIIAVVGSSKVKDRNDEASSVRGDNNWNVLRCSYYYRDHHHQQQHHYTISHKRKRDKDSGITADRHHHQLREVIEQLTEQVNAKQACMNVERRRRREKKYAQNELLRTSPLRIN